MVSVLGAYSALLVEKRLKEDSKEYKTFETDKAVVVYLLANLRKTFSEGHHLEAGVLAECLEFVVKAIRRYGIEQLFLECAVSFADMEELLLSILERTGAQPEETKGGEAEEPRVLLSLFSFMRRMLAMDAPFSQKEKLIDEFMRVSLAKCEEFQQKIPLLRRGARHFEYEYEMIQETAETIAQLAPHVTRKLSEDRLFAFLTCGVESV